MKKSIYRECKGYKYYLIKFKQNENLMKFLTLIKDDFRIEYGLSYNLSSIKEYFNIIEVPIEDEKKFNKIFNEFKKGNKNYIYDEDPAIIEDKTNIENIEDGEERNLDEYDNEVYTNIIKFNNIDSFKLKDSRRDVLKRFLVENKNLDLSILVSEKDSYWWGCSKLDIKCLCGNMFKQYETNKFYGYENKRIYPKKKMDEFNKIGNFIYCEECNREYNIMTQGGYYHKTYLLDKGFLDLYEWEKIFRSAKEHTCIKCEKLIHKSTMYIRYQNKTKFCIDCFYNLLTTYMNEKNENEYYKLIEKNNLMFYDTAFHNKYKILPSKYKEKKGYQLDRAR